MQAWIIHMIDLFGYWGILLLIMIENIFPPIPSEVILTFGGFLTTSTAMTIWGVILFASAGSILGALLLYGVGRILTPELLEQWIASKWGRLLHFKHGDVMLARDKFVTRGESSILIGRCIPIVRSLVSIPAGMARMAMPKFLFFTTIGTLVWNTLLVYLGAAAGESWERIAGYFDTFSTIVLVLLIAVILLLAYLFYKKRIARGKNPRDKTDQA